MSESGASKSFKYQLFYELGSQPVGKPDRVSIPWYSAQEDEDELDAEDVAISVREAVHMRRAVRDLSHCSAANLNLFLDDQSEEEDELQDVELAHLLGTGLLGKLRVVAPAPGLMKLPAPVDPQPLLSSRSHSSSFKKQQQKQQQQQQKQEEEDNQPPLTPSRRDSAASSASKRETETMVVFVKLGDQTFPVEVDSRSATCASLKQRIFDQERITPEQQRLMFGGSELNVNSTLAEHGVHQGADIHLLLTLGSHSP